MEEGLEVKKDIYREITESFRIKRQNICTYSPLAMAYIGDAIYELVIRTIVVAEGNEPVNKMHHRTSGIVKAEAQAKIMYGLMEELTEEEVQIFKRGRNAKSYTSAKNADIADYRAATGFEALMGYLYMEGKMDRLMYLVKKGVEEIL